MKHSVLLSLIIIAIFLQSCDERIAPANSQVESKVLTKTDFLTGSSWQNNEVTVKGGGQTVVQFSRPNSILLTADIGTQKDTYKVDGTYETSKKGIVKSGTWKFSSDEKQLLITGSTGDSRAYNIVNLSQDRFDFNEITKKSDVGIDALWAVLLKGNNLPATTTEFTISVSQIPIR